ncbi:hypothetical protein KP509_12G040800 [Ceratopteris richardii]|uniref:Uncharacterized protein n=1 Tax=Ceratopteris richardii TaxID=49495 RepID=A0A8T2TMV2_CERRI|nr:hypothetical protein KP509_12G040800 [Ceratopteris richardii]
MGVVQGNAIQVRLISAEDLSFKLDHRHARYYAVPWQAGPYQRADALIAASEQPQFGSVRADTLIDSDGNISSLELQWANLPLPPSFSATSSLSSSGSFIVIRLFCEDRRSSSCRSRQTMIGTAVIPLVAIVCSIPSWHVVSFSLKNSSHRSVGVLNMAVRLPFYTSSECDDYFLSRR